MLQAWCVVLPVVGTIDLVEDDFAGAYAVCPDLVKTGNGCLDGCNMKIAERQRMMLQKSNFPEAMNAR